MSLREAYSTLPGGSLSPNPPTIDDIARHLKKKFLDDDSGDYERRMKMKRRLDFYQDRSLDHLDKMIDKLWSDPQVKAERKRFLRFSRFQNVTKRIVHVLSTIYSTDARRSVSDRNDAYQAFIRDAKLDQYMRLANRYSNLCNDVLVWLRSRFESGQWVPVVDVITPDRFSAIPHPLDPSHLVGVMIESTPQAIGATELDPHYWVWSSDEFFALDKRGRFIANSVETNPIGEIPGVLIHREESERLMDPDSGEDIIQAHYSVALLNTLLLHGQKIGFKAPVIRGDTTDMVRGQTLEQGKAAEIGEDNEISTVDLSNDPQSLIDSARNTIAQTASTYDIPEDIFFQSHQASSGHERELKMIGLKQRRQDQIVIFRDAERELARKGALVMEAAADGVYRYRFQNWSVDFGEVSTPMEPMRKLEYRQKARSMGLRSWIDDLMDDDPDLTREAALAKGLSHIEEHSEYVQELRAMNISTENNADNPGQNPEENGREGGQSSELEQIAREVLDE